MSDCGELTDFAEMTISSSCCCFLWFCCCVLVILVVSWCCLLSLVSLLNCFLLEITAHGYRSIRHKLHYHNFFTCSHLFHWLYITVCYRQLLWMSLTSPLAMISTVDSCRIARLCAQQLFDRQKIATSKIADNFPPLSSLTSRFSIIYKFRRLLLFRRWNGVPTAALNDWRLIRLVGIIGRWPRRRCHSSVGKFPSRWRRWVKWNGFEASFNVRRLRRWFGRPNGHGRWVGLLDGGRVTRVLGTIALGPNAYKCRREMWQKNQKLESSRLQWVNHQNQQKRHHQRIRVSSTLSKMWAKKKRKRHTSCFQVVILSYIIHF